MRATLLVLAAILVLGSAEEPIWTKCDESSDEVCSISRITVTPCKTPSACKLVKKKTANIDIDFTPSFGGEDVVTGLFWDSPNGDVPFAELNQAPACEYTSCPLQPGAQHHFHYGLTISQKLPTGTFKLKWKLWKQNDESQMCCFRTTIKIAK